MNPYDLTIPVEELAAYCALTERETKSLRDCPASSISLPEQGTRTAYVCERLPSMGLVTSLWCREDGEVFFTWQRTPPGDRLLDYLDGLGGTTKETQDD